MSSNKEEATTDLCAKHSNVPSAKRKQVYILF
jgi:hypothetical protein